MPLIREFFLRSNSLLNRPTLSLLRFISIDFLASAIASHAISSTSCRHCSRRSKNQPTSTTIQSSTSTTTMMPAGPDSTCSCRRPSASNSALSHTHLLRLRNQSGAQSVIQFTAAAAQDHDFVDCSCASTQPPAPLKFAFIYPLSIALLVARLLLS